MFCKVSWISSYQSTTESSWFHILTLYVAVIRTSSGLPAKTKLERVARYLGRGVTSFLLLTLSISILIPGPGPCQNSYTSSSFWILQKCRRVQIFWNLLFPVIKELINNYFRLNPTILTFSRLVWYIHQNGIIGKPLKRMLFGRLAPLCYNYKWHFFPIICNKKRTSS